MSNSRWPEFHPRISFAPGIRRRKAGTLPSCCAATDGNEPMTTVPVTAGAGRRSGVRAHLGLAAALVAAAALLAGGRHAAAPASPPGRVALAQAWPGAARADLPDLLVSPLLFLDATTVVGT